MGWLVGMDETQLKEKNMGTKIVGYLMIAVALLNVAIDALNGGDFNIQKHIDSVALALTGAGFVRVRKAIDKLGM